MKVQVARMLFRGIIGGQELQGSWHRVSRNIEEYPQNLLAKQARALREEVGMTT